MPDSDSDYVDLADELVNDGENIVSSATTRINANGLKVRGGDRSWIEIRRFSNATGFKESELCKQLEKEVSKRKTREYEYADVKGCFSVS